MPKRIARHRPRVFRSHINQLWYWRCPCGASSYSHAADTQRAACIAAVVHVGSEPPTR